jgi:hypothetical protein
MRGLLHWLKRPSEETRPVAMQDIQRYAMTQREQQIEEFYLSVISRMLQAKDDRERKLRNELRRLADAIENGGIRK